MESEAIWRGAGCARAPWNKSCDMLNDAVQEGQKLATAQARGTRSLDRRVYGKIIQRFQVRSRSWTKSLELFNLCREGPFCAVVKRQCGGMSSEPRESGQGDLYGHGPAVGTADSWQMVVITQRRCKAMHKRARLAEDLQRDAEECRTETSTVLEALPFYFPDHDDAVWQNQRGWCLSGAFRILSPNKRVIYR